MANPIDKGLVVNVGLNDASFASGIKGINQKLRQAQNEFKAMNAIVGKSGKSIQDLSSKYQSATKVYDAQKQKVEALRQEMQKTKASIENNANATQKDKDALLRQTQAYNNAVGQLAKYERQVSSIKGELDEAGGSFGRFGTAIQTTSAKLSNFGSKMQSIGGKMSNVGSSMTSMVSVPVAGALGAATAKAVSFNDEMTKMQSVSNASKAEMDKLKNASLDAAKTYGIGTKEYNSAATELLKSGYSAKESMSIMSAGIKTSKATGEELGIVLDKTSNTMKIFEYGAQDASKVTDKLAYVANASKTSVSELGDGLTKVGPVAHSLGINLDTTASALGVLQDRGFKVEEAATGLRSGLANLVNPSKANAEAFAKLGINLNDVKKNGVNLPKILNDMNQATKGMTKSQKEAYIAQAFGKESMAQWTALMKGDAQTALKTYSKGASDATGSVDKLYKKMEQSPKHKLDQLKGSFESLAVNIGEKVLPALLPIVEKVNSLVNKFGELDEGTQQTIVKFGLLAVAGGPVISTVGKVVSGVGSLAKGFHGAVKGILSFSSKTKTLISGMGGISSKAKGVASSVSKVSSKILDWTKGKVTGAFSSLKGQFSKLGAKADDIKKKVGGIASKFTEWSKGKVTNAFSSLKGNFSKLGKKADDTKGKIGGVTSKIGDWSKDKVKGAFSSLKENFNKLGSKATDAKNKIGGISSKIASWTGDKVKAGFTSLKGALGSIINKANTAKGSVGGITKAASNTGGKGGFFKGLLGSLTGLLGKSKLVSGAIKGISTVLSLMTGPVGIAVGAIALIGGAFITAYKNCKPFRDFINRIGSWFKEKFSAAIKWAKDFGKKLVDHIVNKSVNPISVAVKGWKVAKYFKSKFDASRKEGDSFGTSMKKAMSATVSKMSTTVKNWKIVKWFNDKWESTKKKTNDFKKSLSTKFSNLKADISSKVKSWSIVRWFGDKWSSIKGKTETFKKDMTKKMGDLLNTMVSKIKNSKIGKAFGEAFDAAKKLVAKPVNGIIKGANWVIDKLGGPKETIPPVKWATGTPAGGHPGGLAMVNDGYGPHYQEAITLPNGPTFIAKGRNTVMDLPPGTQVTDGRTTHKALKAGLLKYKDGTDESWLSKAWNWGKKAISNVGDFIGDVMDYMDDPMKLVKKVVENFVNFSGLVKYPLDLGKGIIRKGVDALKNKVQEMFDSMMSDDVSGGGWGDLGSNKWFQIHGNWVREWQYRLLEPIIKQYGFRVTDGGRRTWDNFDHSKGKAMDIALPGNPQGTYWKVAKQIDAMPLVSYVNSNLKSSYGHKGRFTPSNLEPRADHIHVSFKKELLSEKELRGSSGGSMGNPGGSGVQRWRPYVIKALKANGLPTTSAYVNAWLRQIQSESGGDPKAVQHGYVDINTGGNEARGLLQTVPGTFNAHKFPGHGNIYNGYDNMLAAIHYAKSRYGAKGMLQVIGHGHGYEKGGLVTTQQIAQLAEGNKPEMVIPLTNKSRSVQLINKAKRLIGEDVFEQDDKALREQTAILNDVKGGIDLLGLLLNAILHQGPGDVYLDYNKVGSYMKQQENNARLKRNIAQGII